MDLSLDDVIKQQRSKNKKSAGGPGPKGSFNKLRKLGARSGIAARKPNLRQNLNSNTGASAGPQRREPTKLHVSNLDFGVSDSDIRELFNECGVIKKASIHYDKSGRSLGTAEVVFVTRDAAVRAIQKYNAVPLDGRPLNLALVPSASTAAASPQKSNRLGPRSGGGVVKQTQQKPRLGAKGPRGQNKNTNNKGTFKRNQRSPKKAVTAEDLDADLEAYTRSA